MELREILEAGLDIGVLLSLLGMLMFVTGAVKAKKDPDRKKKHTTLAWVFLGVYSLLNLLRMLMEQGIL